MRIRWDAPVDGAYLGLVFASGTLAFFGFQASLQIRLSLYGRTVPATLLDSHRLGRGGSVCTYAYVADAEPRTLKGSCYFVPRPAIDYLPGDPDLARNHGQPNLQVDAGVAMAALTLLGGSLWHLRARRRS